MGFTMKYPATATTSAHKHDLKALVHVDTVHQNFSTAKARFNALLCHFNAQILQF